MEEKNRIIEENEDEAQDGDETPNFRVLQKKHDWDIGEAQMKFIKYLIRSNASLY